MATRKQQTFYVRGPRYEQARLIRGTEKEVQVKLVGEIEIRPATDTEINELGHVGVSIEDSTPAGTA